MFIVASTPTVTYVLSFAMGFCTESVSLLCYPRITISKHQLFYHFTTLHFSPFHRDILFSLNHFFYHLPNFLQKSSHHSNNIYHIRFFYRTNILLRISFHLATYKSLIHASYSLSNGLNKLFHHNVCMSLSLIFFLETIILHK